MSNENDQIPLDKISLRPLKNLKSVGFSDFRNPNTARIFINHLIEAELPVEYLSLQMGDINEYTILNGLSQLKVLEIGANKPISRISVESIINSVKNVEKLSELHINNGTRVFYIGDETFKMLAAIQKRKKTKKLVIQFENHSMNVSAENRKKYCDVLEIQNLS